MAADKLLIITSVIALILLAAGYYRIEQNIYSNGIAVKDDLQELNNP